eukprot:gene10313-biopygen2574
MLDCTLGCEVQSARPAGKCIHPSIGYSLIYSCDIRGKIDAAGEVEHGLVTSVYRSSDCSGPPMQSAVDPLGKCFPKRGTPLVYAPRTRR